MAPQTRRTRRSAALAARSEVPDSDDVNSVVSSGGESITVGHAPQAKPSRASSSTLSSAPTPKSLFSEGEYATPLTSNAATPTQGEGSGSYFPKPGNKIEVHLPQSRKAAADTHKQLQKSIYAMNSKRKRAPDEDSEEEYDSDTSDARLARKLMRQEEEETSLLAVRRTRGFPAPALPTRKSTRNASRSSLSTGDVFGNPGQPTGISPPAETNKGKKKITPKRSAAVVVSDEDDDEIPSEPDEVGDSEGDDSYRSDSDVPLARRPKQVRRPIPTRSQRSTRSQNLGEDPEPASLELDEMVQNDLDQSEASWSEISEITGISEFESDVAPVAPRPQPVTFQELREIADRRRAYRRVHSQRRAENARLRLESNHPFLRTLWADLEKMPILKAGKAEQPSQISRQLKPFQLEGLAWMQAMEKHEWKGGILGDEMGLGKTIQAVSLIMSDWPAKKPSLVLVPPVALMQWMTEIEAYTNGTLKTLFFHGTNTKSKNMTVKELKQYDVIVMSYNSLESMYRKQEKGFKRKDGLYKEDSNIHKIHFHRVILDEAHSIKSRVTMTAKACFALKVDYRWCLSGTPLQNRIGEFFSLVRFLNIRPFAYYLCKACTCSSLEWSMDDSAHCTKCKCPGMQHISVFNQELLNPIQKYGNQGPGAVALKNLRIMTDRIMLRRLKKDHTNSMELPVKEIHVDRQFFGEEENDFANSIMTNGQRNFDTYVAQGVLLNNYANIFGLIMQMRQVADHPDLILKKSAAGGQNVLVCCICDEPAEEAIRSRCRHDFCRSCAKSYLFSSDQPDCPQCHIPLSIDLEQPEIEQDEDLVKKTSIINRIKMENWTSSSKIELLVHELHKLRSDNASHKSIIFSQFTTMLQLIEWRLRRAGITTVMLDGSMTPTQRQASIDYFMKNAEVECFLVSLKAGGVALNLTEASQVFIVDPWWNPAAEWQSADRCHRIGQTRPCTITRLCIEDSVESRMVLLQEKKTNMINSTINADDKAMDSLSPQDLQFLFRGS
ncbi:hypothetical protein VTK73DRAFT_9049 [Phialemonium thermophilum]|uniref:DNA repair protein RAD16 n=1 Tax=Phialemonium thermophilum TaxID=223376 RepID=A0ABR3XMC7_9PEZI